MVRSGYAERMEARGRRGVEPPRQSAIVKTAGGGASFRCLGLLVLLLVTLMRDLMRVSDVCKIALGETEAELAGIGL
jgi:hypothetical protein